MSKIKQFIKNISPLNNRTDMPVLLYIIKVIIIFWFVKFGAELIGEGLVIALHFACGMQSGWNYILFNILGLNLSGNDELTAAVFDMRSAGENILNGGKYGIEASAITAIVLAVFLIICYTISRKEESKEEQR